MAVGFLGPGEPAAGHCPFRRLASSTRRGPAAPRPATASPGKRSGNRHEQRGPVEGLTDEHVAALAHSFPELGDYVDGAPSSV
jgi:hypothetical protein